MSKKFKQIFREYWWAILLFLLVLVAYGQTLNMYFWVDDWGMAYKMRYPEADIPNFGPGIFGNGAYRYNVTPFILLYPLFGLNATIYFAIGLAFYFLATLAVYLLAKELSGKKLIGLISAAIFASGYIGSDAMYHLNNSYQLVHTAALSALTIWLLVKHYQTDSIKYYFLALLLYATILEFLFLRSHGVFLLILSAAFLALVLYRKKFLPTVIKFAPFFLIWFYMFFLDPRTSKEYDGYGRGDLLPNTINILFKERHFELFNNFLITVSSVIFPDQVLFSLYRFITLQLKTQSYLPLALPLVAAFSLLFFLYIKYKLPMKALASAALLLGSFFVYLVWSVSQTSAVWSPDKAQLFISAWFWAFLIILGSLYFLPKLRKRLYLAYFGLAWIVSNVVIYFIYTPTTNLASNSRYLTPAFIGTCLLFGNIFSLFSKKRQFFAFALVFIYSGFLISLTNERSAYVVKNISNAAREDLKIIKNTVQSMNKDTVFYFEAARGSRFSKSELGGMPHLAIPLALSYEGRAKIALSYEDLLFLIKQGKADVKNIYTFFAKNGALENTTDHFVQYLTVSQAPYDINSWKSNTPSGKQSESCCQTRTLYLSTAKGTVGVNPVLESQISYSSLTPSVLTLELVTQPVPVSNFAFPYKDLTALYSTEISNDLLNRESINLTGGPRIGSYTDYLISDKERAEFYSSIATSFANSEERTREASFLIDGKFYTNWEAKSMQWRQGLRPIDILFTLKSPMRFSSLTWVNHNYKTTPSQYTISASSDGAFWKTVKNVNNKVWRESGEVITDKFDATKANSWKISIEETYGEERSAPAIRELWLGNQKLGIDLDTRNKVLSCLLCNATDSEDARKTISLYEKVATGTVSWTTDKNETFNVENSQEFPIHLDGKRRKYQIYLSPQGTYFQKIKLSNFAIPLEVAVLSASIRSLSLNELIEKDLIHDFAD